MFRPYRVLAAAAFAMTATLSAQSSPAKGSPRLAAEATLPDAPSSSQADPQQAKQPAGNTPETNQIPEDTPSKRILGIIPNYRSVSAGSHLKAQTPREKGITAAQDSFDYSAFVLAALVAVEGYATDASPEFGSGGLGYSRYLWHSFADQTLENTMVEFLVPIVTREDTRYYTLGHGSFRKRAGYALSRAFITRSDSGHDTFNASEVVGAGLAAGLSNLYYPSRERTVGNTLSKYAVNIGIDTGSYLFREFDNDLARKFTKKK